MGARFAGAIRLAIAAAFVALGLLLIACSQTTRGASASPDGCPDGYHWERMSGVGCVQTTLPDNARYGYTGAAICNEPYVAIGAPGPNAYGSDPNTNYLVECITAEEYAARASAAAAAAAAPRDGGDGTLSDADFASPGIVDDLAKALLGDDVQPPAQSDADLGGVTATGVLLMSLGAAVMIGSPSGIGGLGGVSGGGAAGGAGGAGSAGSAGGAQGGGVGGAAGAAGGAAGGTASGSLAGAASGAAAGAGSLISAGLPADKGELLLVGLSIYRSMKRVTSEADPESLNAGDAAQLMGDAAGIATLATALAPAIGAVALTAGGLAAAVETRSPRDVVEQMRRNLGRLGYMRGLVDEGVGEKEGQLLDIGASALPAAPAPVQASKLASLSAGQLRTARDAWAARTAAILDTAAALQDELNDLDDRRHGIAQNVDDVADLLARFGKGGEVSLPEKLGPVLLYGRGWHLASDPSKMAAAFRDNRTQTRAAIAAGQRPARPARRGASGAAAASQAGSQPFTLWAEANRIANGRTAVLEALAGLERWRGFCDALASSVGQQLAALRIQADEAGAARQAIAGEIQRRAVEGASK